MRSIRGTRSPPRRRWWTCSGRQGLRPTLRRSPPHHDVLRPEEFWDVVFGSGYRGTVDALQPDRQHEVRRQLLHALRAQQITRLRSDVTYATARRAP